MRAVPEEMNVAASVTRAAVVPGRTLGTDVAKLWLSVSKPVPRVPLFEKTILLQVVFGVKKFTYSNYYDESCVVLLGLP